MFGSLSNRFVSTLRPLALSCSIVVVGCISSEAADELGEGLGRAFATAVGEAFEPVFDATVSSETGEAVFVACEDAQGCVPHPYVADPQPLRGSIVTSFAFDGARLREGSVLTELVVAEPVLLEGSVLGEDEPANWSAEASFVVTTFGVSTLEILRAGEVIETLEIETLGSGR